MATKSELSINDFQYCDVYHPDDSDRPQPWKRIHINEIAEYQQNVANNYRVFATVQRFPSPVRMKGEPVIAPLFFDLDSDKNPENSQKDAAKITSFFTDEMDLQPSDLQIFYSGSKGFHILIDPVIIGIEPRPDLHKVMKHLAGYLVERLEIATLDLGVYGDRRMLRLPLSIHEKTKLFKTPITFKELHTLTIDEIKAMAAAPRSIEEPKAKGVLRPRAGHLYKDKLAEYIQAAVATTSRYDKTDYRFTRDVYPACVQDILDNGWKKAGDRNAATVQLACFFKAAEYDQDEALTTLEEWVLRFTTADSGYQKEQRRANTRSVVNAVYSKDNEYKFGCAFIRSLHGDKKPGVKEYDRVKCAGDLCPCLIENVDEAKIPECHLAQAGNAEFTNKLIKTKVMVAGKKSTPYIVPKDVEYYCWGYKTCSKSHCPLYELPTHTGYKNLGITNRELIQMCGSTDDVIHGILKSISAIPDCKRYNTEVTATINVDELAVIPMASAISDDDNREQRYVLRRVYNLGGSNVLENKYYEITGYVYPHPKNQEATILLKNAKSLQDVVESFSINDDIKRDLETLRPSRDDDSDNSTRYDPGKIDGKIKSICDDLTYNVTHIVERDTTLLGVLLVLHSILKLKVPWANTPIRGWLELMILGDTGTGKSMLIEEVLRYAGLGTRINAETTGRTGLTYKMEQAGSGGSWLLTWGAWPLSDKELIWIDEAPSIPAEEYAQMTMARSDGRLEVKKAASAETPCRVRAILSGNVPKGKRIAAYSQGAEVLKDIFFNEDIRRFDFAIFMKMMDVDPEAYNRVLPTYPKSITATTLKHNVLFAWSRTPEQVKFAPGTIEATLKAATSLSKTYGAATDVPLVSPADQRNKVIRIAAALAALTHSVDDSGENIIVYPGHVEYTEVYLRDIYNAPGCGLNFLAKVSVKEEELTDSKYTKIEDALRKLSVLRGDQLYGEFIRLFAKQRYLAVKDVEDMLNIERDQAKAITTLLTRLNMVIKTSGGLKKTPLFNSFVTRCFGDGMFEDEDN
ncbi:MAG: hypothetical protein H6Q67_2295 [Firmicutes bacterium]|nr:hypothetical protein [Bacillota bacterium]